MQGSPCPECGAPAFERRDVIDSAGVSNVRTRWVAGALLIGLVALFVAILWRGFW